MKFLKFLFLSMLISGTISCNEVKKEVTTEKAVIIAADYKNLEVSIEGMTCEIGCARTIQSKLSKMEGIDYANVSFESKTGQFTYDANTISPNDIVKKINGIAGGDLYRVTESKEIEKISKNPSKNKS